MGEQFTAAVGEPVDRLTKSAKGEEGIVRSRTIEITDGAGQKIRTLASADDPTDVREKIEAAGYRIVSEGAGGFQLERGPMSGGRKWSLGCLGVFLAFVLFIVVSCSIQMNSPENKGPKPPTELDARIACQDLVSKRLKSPSTAKFGGEDESLVSGTWTATGTVDSQNGFGAMIRGSYTCTMTFNPAKDSFSGTVNIK